MSKEFEIKKLEVSLLQTQAVIAELELKIFERYEDIQRIEDHILLQKQRIADLQDSIDKAKSE